MIILRKKEEMEKYYVEAVNTYVFKDNVEFLCDIYVRANIKADDINARIIKAYDINALNIKALDIKASKINARNIYADNINAFEINADDIKADDINALNINAWNIDSNDINARNIKAWNIRANTISYFAVCFAYKNIHCNSIEGERENSKHFVLDGELVVGGKKTTSKETAENLNGFVPIENHINSERNAKIKECYGVIEKDLERLEKLEKENKVLREKVNHFKNVKNRYRRNEKFVEKENEKLEKAIEILNRFHFKLNETRHNYTGFELWTDSLLEYEEITQEEYELLKGVLGND